MSAFSILGTLTAVKDYLLSSGLFLGGAQIGEPKAPQAAGFAASVFNGAWHVAQLTLNNTIEEHVVIVRIYRNMLADPEADIETDVANRMDLLKAFVAGHYQLDNAGIRAVDVGGMYGTALRGQFGYADIAGTMHRFAEMSLPVIVDDSAELAP